MREPSGKLDKGKTCIPALGACVGNYKAPLYASVAQLVESTTDNRVVTGPNPVVCTIAHCAAPFFLVLTKSYIFPPGVDVYDCSTRIQKRGCSDRLVGVSFRASPTNKTGCFYLRQSDITGYVSGLGASISF